MSASSTQPSAAAHVAKMPSVTVLISTRDRGDSIVTPIRSVLACAAADFTLVIVDQSDDQHTARAIATTFQHEPRLRYIYTCLRGKSLAGNIGIAFIRSDLVLLIDDDCEVTTDWITQMVEPFVRYPQVGIVFCNVIPAPHDSDAGFIPDCISPRSFLVDHPLRWQTSDGLNIGIGAGMALRRSTAEALHGFSPLFGPGSRFRSGDDTDFTLRALIAGHHIYRTNSVSVTHYGFRTYEQGRKLIRNNMYGLGGIYGQLIRRGHWFAIARVASVFQVMVIRPALGEARHLRLPRVLGRLHWLIRGLITGMLIAPSRQERGLSGVTDR